MSTKTQPTEARPRVARRRVETRARLLSIAGRLFAERGFAAVRLDEIADAAEVARGTLYSHFESKDELYRAVVEPVLERAMERMQPLRKAASPLEALRELLRTYFDLWRVSPDAMRVAHRVDHSRPRDLAPLDAAHVQQVMEVMSRAGEAGLLRLEDPRLSARALAMTAVPLLEVVSALPQAESAFLSAMEGLLLRPGTSGAAGH